jgi:hypothetical protein
MRNVELPDNLMKSGCEEKACMSTMRDVKVAVGTVHIHASLAKPNCLVTSSDSRQEGPWQWHANGGGL